eukprot:XP_011610718.1 PREDICTED: RNA-binding protein 20 [Takifugu rubripes]
MQQALDRTGNAENDRKEQRRMLGTGQCGGYLPETGSQLLHSAGAVSEGGDNAVGGQAAGGVQQNQQLLLSPAGLQLAQLQAQLSLQRLKLAQQGNTATTASVLNQVLSNVAMSHPLFNQLRTTAVVGNPQGAFHAGVLGFPGSASAFGTLVGGGFNQNQGNVRLTHPGGGGRVGQQGSDYSKKSGSPYPVETDKRLQFSAEGATAASAPAADGQYPAINTQAQNMNSAGFQRDYNGHEMVGQAPGFKVAERNLNLFNSSGHKEQWKGQASLSLTENLDRVSKAADVWTAAGPSFHSRTELYNPEEPTPDPKFNSSSGVSSFGASGGQMFGGYQYLHGTGETLSSGSRTLQPGQVNDYHAVTPNQLPHMCSICNKKVYNLKDWDQHVKGKLHLQNRMLYASEGSAAVQFAIGGPSERGVSVGDANAMVYPAAAAQDAPLGVATSYLPGAAMATYPMSEPGFASHQPESKPFPPRKVTAGRVVHICNLPEGSCTENDVINLGLPFGKVTNYILMRSTHQAFLEMAYVEAAQAMVQYYQLTPAMINNQKLLIRMSKRYKELQLKKPGKDVESIIQDISSQRERDEMQELEHYVPERPRSRSPISRSLSPHSPSFTSCSSAHSPQGASSRGAERGSNGMGPRRGSWDWSPHLRRGEDERERDLPWRNGGGADDERPNGRSADRRKAYPKHLDHVSSRSAEERGGGGGEGMMRSNRDWHPRGSPQDLAFSSYRSMEDDFYTKEQMYKSERPPRPPYQWHETKPKRRDYGEYHRGPRHPEMTEEPPRRSEDRRQSSPGRSRSKRTSKRHTSAEKQERENTTESTDRRSKEKSASPQESNKSKEAPESTKEAVKECQSENDTDEDCWYPKNMEELVTVDEVGEDDDSIIEPDLPELEKFVSWPKETAEGEAVEEKEADISPPTPSTEVQEKPAEVSHQEKLSKEAGDPAETAVTVKPEPAASASSPENQTQQSPQHPAAPEPAPTALGDAPTEELNAKLEQTCLEEKATSDEPPEEPEVLFPCPGQEKAASEHSIPLGVEFVVPWTGFYCQLCGLFYTSEDTAKASHCRSTVHYRNLQKYLSQLAEESLTGTLAKQSAVQ